MRTGSLHSSSSSSRDNTQSEPSPPLKHQPAAALANQETPTANHPQFDLDAKMEKMAPLKFPETFGKASSRGLNSMNNKTSASSSCRSKPANSSIVSHPSSKAFDSSSRSNKKSVEDSN